MHNLGNARHSSVQHIKHDFGDVDITPTNKSYRFCDGKWILVIRRIKNNKIDGRIYGCKIIHEELVNKHNNFFELTEKDCIFEVDI
jgi:hypothetical protein